nr:immunoglobulin light chain junction region [Macaca mulatta]
CMRALDFPLTF